MLIFIQCLMTLICSCENKKIFNQEESHSYLGRLKSLGINISPQNINSYNDSNKKHGLWIIENDTYIYLTTYNNGRKDGVESIYYKYKKNKTLELNYTLTYNQGVLTNAIMYDKGKVYSIIEKVGSNDNYQATDTFFKYYGFCKDYDVDGKIEAEGPMVFGEEWEIDFKNVGKWKIYDKNGSFIIKDYDK